MEKSTITTTTVEANESQLPNHTDNDCQEFYQNDHDNPTPFRKIRPPWHFFITVMLAIMLVTTSLQAYQYKEYGEVLAKEAYVISVSIDLMEDNLMLKYGVFPNDIGLGELRSAWIENPCRETSMAYYDALKYALDYFEQETPPSETFTPVKV